jgi:hypothetical protein
MPERTCSVDGCCAPHRARGLCSTHYNQQRQPDRHKKSTTPCSVCGRPTLKPKQKRYRPVCSMDCRWFLQDPVLSCPIPESHPAHPRWHGRLLPVLWIPPPAAKPKSSTKRWVAGNCQRCCRPFIAEDYTNQARYCSTPCYRSDSKDRRRARKREAFVAPVFRRLIFERDGWRCRLCGKAVRREAQPPEPLAPVLDHIVPLACGGSHEPANVQCAHFMCNSIKGHRGGNEQLLLFG